METESTNESASTEPVYCNSTSSSLLLSEQKLRVGDDSNGYMQTSSKNSSDCHLNISDEYDADKEEALSFYIVSNMPSISPSGSIEKFSKFYQKIVQSNSNRSHYNTRFKQAHEKSFNIDTERKVSSKSKTTIHNCFLNHNHSSMLNKNKNETQHRNACRYEGNRKYNHSKQMDVVHSPNNTKSNVGQNSKELATEMFSVYNTYNLRESSSSLSSVSSMSTSESRSVERSLSFNSKVDLLSNISSPRASVRQADQHLTFKQLLDRNEELIDQLNTLTSRFKKLNHEETEKKTDYQTLKEQREKFYLHLQNTIHLFIKTNTIHQDHDSQFKEFELISESLTVRQFFSILINLHIISIFICKLRIGLPETIG
jgi:hypothetical protein